MNIMTRKICQYNCVNGNFMGDTARIASLITSAGVGTNIAQAGPAQGSGAILQRQSWPARPSGAATPPAAIRNSGA